MIEMTCACGNPALRSTWSHTPTACELPPRRLLGRIAAINGNVVTIADGLTDGFRIGQRIIADDNRAGITPNAGFTTVEEVDADAKRVRVDGPARMNACVGDYLFEKQPTDEESRAADIERRLADLESGAVPPAHPDPAALIRAAIAKATPRAVCNPADLMALATALECVNRALPVTDLMQPPDLKRVDELVQLRRRLAKVEALANHWRSRDTGDQWAVRDLCAALRGEDPSDG